MGDKMEERTYATGETVFAEGDPGDAMYVVAQGAVVILKTVDRASGAQRAVAVMERGDFLGEMALLEKSARSATARAQGEARLYRLGGADFDALFNHDSRFAPEILWRFITTMGARLRRTTAEMVALFDVGRALAEDLPAKELAGRLLKRVHASFNEEAVFGVFYLVNEFTGEWEPAAVLDKAPPAWGVERSGKDPVFRRMAETGGCVRSTDLRVDSAVPPEGRAGWPGTVSFLAAPIPGEKGPVGYMVFGHGSKVDRFTEEHRRLVAAVANLVAPAFENAAWREETRARRRLERSRHG
jgi:CRP-like cAMP-binding protein